MVGRTWRALVAAVLVSATLGSTAALTATVVQASPAAAQVQTVRALVMLCTYVNQFEGGLPFGSEVKEPFEGGFPSVEDYFWTQTMGTVDYDFDFGDERWESLPFDKSTYDANAADPRPAIMRDCKEAYGRDATDYSDYDLYITILAGDSKESAASGRDVFLRNGDWHNMASIVHELGHAAPFNLKHTFARVDNNALHTLDEKAVNDAYSDHWHAVSARGDADRAETHRYISSLFTRLIFINSNSYYCSGPTTCDWGDSIEPVGMSGAEIAGIGRYSPGHPMFPHYGAGERYDVFGGTHFVPIDAAGHGLAPGSPNADQAFNVMRIFTPDGRYQYTVWPRLETDGTYDQNLFESGVVIYRTDLTLGVNADYRTELMIPPTDFKTAWQPNQTFTDPLTGVSVWIAGVSNRGYVVSATVATPTPEILFGASSEGGFTSTPVAVPGGGGTLVLRTRGFVATPSFPYAAPGTVPMTRVPAPLDPFFTVGPPSIVSSDPALQDARFTVNGDPDDVRLVRVVARNQRILNFDDTGNDAVGNEYVVYTVGRTGVDVGGYGTIVGDGTATASSGGTTASVDVSGVGTAEVSIAAFDASNGEPADANPTSSTPPGLPAQGGFLMVDAVGLAAGNEGYRFTVRSCDEAPAGATFNWYEPGVGWHVLPTTYDVTTHCYSTSPSAGDPAWNAFGPEGVAFGLFSTPYLVRVDTQERYGEAVQATATPVAGQSTAVPLSLNGTPTCTLAAAPVGTSTVDPSACSGVSLVSAFDHAYVLRLVGGQRSVSPGRIDVRMSGHRAGGASTYSTDFEVVDHDVVRVDGTTPEVVELNGDPVVCTSLDDGRDPGAVGPGRYTFDPDSCSGLLPALRRSGALENDPNRVVRYLAVTDGFTVGEPVYLTVTGHQAYGGSIAWEATPTNLPSGASVTGTPTCTRLADGSPIPASLPPGPSVAVDPTSCTGTSVAGAPMYTVAASATLTVAKGVVAVTPSGTWTYGQQPPALSQASSPPSPYTVVGTVVCTQTSTGATIDRDLPAGTHQIDPTSCSGASLSSDGGTYYDVAYLPGSVTVEPAVVDVAVTGTQTYRQPEGRLILADLGSLPAGVTASGAITCTDLTTPGTGFDVNAGPHTIDLTTCSGLALSNPSYAIRYVDGTFTMAKLAIPVAVTGTMTYGQTAASWSPAHVNPAPDEITIDGEPSCTRLADGSTIGATTPAGSYEVDPTSCSGLVPLVVGGSEASSNFELTYTGTLEVRPAPVAIAVTAEQTYGGPLVWGHDEVLPSGVGIDGVVVCAAGPEVQPVGSHPLDVATCAGLILTGEAASNYVIVYATANRVVTAATLTVAAQPASSTYGDGDPSFGWTASGWVNDEGPSTFTTPPNCGVDGDHRAVATYSIVCDDAVAPNYTIEYQSAAYTVDPAALTVVAEPKTREYAAANPALTVRFEGFQYGEDRTTAGITGAAACTTTAVATSPVAGSPYPITCGAGTLAAANYVFTTFVPSTLTVTKAATSLAIAGPVRGLLTTTLSARLTRTHDGAPLAGRTVVLEMDRLINVLGILKISSTAACTATTGADGRASCTVLTLPGTPGPVRARFAGDADHRPAP